MPFVKLKGFAPDAEDNEEGIIVSGTAFMPTIRGIAPIPAGTDAAQGSLTGSCRGAANLELLDGTTRFFAAAQLSDTRCELFEATTSAWTDRTRAAGDYTTTARAVWTFAQYNNISLAAGKPSLLQASDTTGAFGELTATGRSTTASLTYVPRAAIVETVLDFVFAFNTNTIGFGDDTNRWQCSAAGNHLDWVPNISTLSASNLLSDTAGRIRAAKRLGSDMVAYKRNSMYLGQFVGPPSVWSFRLIPGTGLGAPGPHSVADIRTAHIFPATDDFYIYDGTRPVPIGTNRVSEFFFNDLNENFAEETVALHDRNTWRVFWFYPSTGSTTGELDSCIIYNYRSDRWGFTRVDDWLSATSLSRVQFAVPFTEAGLIYDDLGTFYSTYDDLPAQTYDDAFGVAGNITPVYFANDKPRIFRGGAAPHMTIETGDYGADGTIQKLQRIRPRFLGHTPIVGAAAHYVKDSLGDSPSLGAVSVFLQRGLDPNTHIDNSLDAITIGRWHRSLQVYVTTQDFEITGFDLEINVEEQE